MVFPGVPDTRASDFLFRSLFIIDDLPTFDRPANANSSISDLGYCDFDTADFSNCALLKFIFGCILSPFPKSNHINAFSITVSMLDTGIK